jgi:hypothetical protein
VTLTRYEWSRLWWLASGMSGRLVQPCIECGALLRLSAMRLFTGVGALGLLGSSIALSIARSDGLLVVSLAFSILIFVGVLSTRVEAVRRIAQGSPS